MKKKLLIKFFVFLTLHLCAVYGQNCTAEFPCVRFCCANCTDDVDVTDQPGAENMKTNYQVLFGKPCKTMYKLEPEEYGSDAWSLSEVKLNRVFEVL